jgi:DNA-binding protein HU-beta
MSSNKQQSLNKKLLAEQLLEYEVVRKDKNGKEKANGRKMIKNYNGMTKELATDIVNAIFDGDNGIIAKALHGGQKVTIPGFGTFNTRYRQERDGSHPDPKLKENGKPKKITIPASWVVTFKVGKTLKNKAHDSSR